MDPKAWGLISAMEWSRPNPPEHQVQQRCKTLAKHIKEHKNYPIIISPAANQSSNGADHALY